MESNDCLDRFGKGVLTRGDRAPMGNLMRQFSDLLSSLKKQKHPGKGKGKGKGKGSGNNHSANGAKR